MFRFWRRSDAQKEELEEFFSDDGDRAQSSVNRVPSDIHDLSRYGFGLDKIYQLQDVDVASIRPMSMGSQESLNSTLSEVLERKIGGNRAKIKETAYQEFTQEATLEETLEEALEVSSFATTSTKKTQIGVSALPAAGASFPNDSFFEQLILPLGGSITGLMHSPLYKYPLKSLPLTKQLAKKIEELGIYSLEQVLGSVGQIRRIEELSPAHQEELVYKIQIFLEGQWRGAKIPSIPWDQIFKLVLSTVELSIKEVHFLYEHLQLENTLSGSLANRNKMAYNGYAEPGHKQQQLVEAIEKIAGCMEAKKWLSYHMQAAVESFLYPVINRGDAIANREELRNQWLECSSEFLPYAQALATIFSIPFPDGWLDKLLENIPGEPHLFYIDSQVAQKFLQLRQWAHRYFYERGVVHSLEDLWRWCLRDQATLIRRGECFSLEELEELFSSSSWFEMRRNEKNKMRSLVECIEW